MKIAILTQPLTNNYGGILQNYALQEVLRRVGHDVVTLNIRRPTAKLEVNLHFFLSVIKRFVQKYIMHDPQIIYVCAYKQTNFGNTPTPFPQRFLSEYIKMEMAGPEPLTATNDKYEVYVVGSDQVWRPCFSTTLLNYYLNFVKNSKAIRLAYAVSLGVDYWETDRETTAVASTLAQQFKAISVREHSGIQLCREHLGVNAVQTLDPTMLLDAEDYRKLYQAHHLQYSHGEYIAVYILDRNPKIRQTIQRASMQLGLPIKQLGALSKDGFDSIESWLEGIDNASYVITDSFHGSVFSMIFGKQFVTFDNKARGVARLQGLFSQFEITHRLADANDDIIGILQTVIDYVSVHKKMQKERAASLLFLDKYLK